MMLSGKRHPCDLEGCLSNQEEGTYIYQPGALCRYVHVLREARRRACNGLPSGLSRRKQTELDFKGIEQIIGWPGIICAPNEP